MKFGRRAELTRVETCSEDMGAMASSSEQSDSDASVAVHPSALNRLL
jgi:hypothetical protein